MDSTGRSLPADDAGSTRAIDQCPGSRPGTRRQSYLRTSSSRRRLPHSAEQDARLKQVSLHWPRSTPAIHRRVRLLNAGRGAPRSSRRRALRCGISWSNGRPADCATCATCSAITAYRRRCTRAWARLPESRCPCLASSDSAQRDSALPSGFQVSGYRSCPGRLGSDRGARVAESRYDFHAAPILAQTLKRGEHAWTFFTVLSTPSSLFFWLLILS